MSKKSRKRNKKILAAIGIGLGAAALAKNKRDKSIDSGIEAANADKGSDMLSKTVTPKKKPDSKMPDNITKDMGKDNKPQKLRFGQVKTKTGEIKATKPFSFLSGSKKDDKPALPGKTMAESNQVPTKRLGDTYYSDGSKRLGANNRSTSTTLPGMKSGGRVKGCGKALRGFGKAMKGKR
jgi:hypothetical protein